MTGETRHAIRATMLDAIHREYGTAWEQNNAEHQGGDEFGRGDPERWPTLNHVLDVLSEAVEAAHFTGRSEAKREHGGYRDVFSAGTYSGPG